MMEEAIFDIVLMSRCQKIIAGESGFAILSSWIGGVNLESFDNYIPEERAIESFNQAYEPNGILHSNQINPLLRSFSMLSHIENYTHLLTITEKINILTAALKLDEGNIYTKLLLAMCLYESGSESEADKLLFKEIKEAPPYSFFWAFRAIHERRIQYNSSIKRLASYMNGIKKYGMKGSLVALYISALYERNFGDSFGKVEYKEVLESCSNNKLGYNELALLIKD